ncbi:antibiotic transporter [Spirochaetia bacterium]|nr:antibiotic transporter [Spirochaetia bacterium]
MREKQSEPEKQHKLFQLNTLFKHPALIVVITAIITVFFALQLPRAELDNNNFRFVPADDPALIDSSNIDETFGSSLFILVGLERKYGTVFEKEFLERIRNYVNEIEKIAIVTNVNSLMTTDYITGRDGSIIAEDLVPDDFSGTPEEIAELKRKIMSWNLYERALVSDDFSATQIMIPLDVDTEYAGTREVSDSFIIIRDIAHRMFDGYAEVYVTGLPVISATVNEAMSKDLVVLIPLVIVVVLFVLFFSFRRFSMVALPLLTVAVSAIWSIGAMPLFGIKLSIISTVLPVIMVAVGSAYGIHVVTHYMSDIRGRIFTREEHRQLIFELVRKIGKPVLLAALTTFAGFASFIFTSVLPIREFGYFSSFGVMASFAVALTLIPSLLIIRGPGRQKQQDITAADQSEAHDPISTSIAVFFSTIAKKKRFVLFVTAVITLFSLYGLSKVIIDNVMVEYFKSSTDIVKSDRFIREQFGGSKVVSIVVEAETSEELLHPDVLTAMDGLSAYLAKVPEVGKVIGFTDLVKRINQVFNESESPDGLGFAEDYSDGGGSGDIWGSFGYEDGGYIEGSYIDGSFTDDDGGFDSFDDSIYAYDDNFYDGTSSGSFAGEITLPELMALLDDAALGSRNMSAGDLVRELKRLTNYDGVSYYEIPSDAARYGKTSRDELSWVVANYLILLSGSIDEYANDPNEPTAIKSTVQLRTVGQADSDVAISAMYGYIDAYFPKNVKVTIGGSALVEGSLNDLVVESQLISVIISLLMVFIIIAVSNRSFVAGIIGIVPLSISILINFAVMGFLGIKLNIGTSMIASVSVGIGIDYTIHYIESYKREYKLSGGQGNYIAETFAVSGKAILINAVSVGAGFAVLLLSQFNMLAEFGFLIALTMCTSAIVSLTVIPALLTLIEPKFVTK